MQTLFISCESAVELRENTSMPNIDNQTMMIAIVAVTALAVLFQAIVLLAIFFSRAQGCPLPEGAS